MTAGAGSGAAPSGRAPSSGEPSGLQRTGRGARGLIIWIPVGTALVVTLGLLWLITREPLVVGGYGGGLVVLGALAALLGTQRPRPVLPELAAPDWSVTVAAISRAATAVAITDRAGRLVCANSVFEECFGIAAAPPAMAFDEGSLERLATAARSAWRDGTGGVDGLDPADGGGRWRCGIQRAGRGEDYLIWQFKPLRESDPVAPLAAQLNGTFGQMLIRAGIVAVIVDELGVITAAHPGAAARALDDPFGLVIGASLVSLLHEDEGKRIRWAREAGPGPALTLFQVPLGEPEQLGAAAAANGPSLVLIAEASAGIGAGTDAAGAIPHLEELLRQLPLGLAMADRDGRLMFANPAFLRAAGHEDRTPPVYPSDLVAREDKAALSEAVRRSAQGSTAATDITVRLASQPDEPVSLSLAAVRGLGQAAVLLGLTDSTEEARLKRQVAQATKMQAVGQLAGGVAHDFNNVLTAVLGTCDLMLMRHLPGDSDYDDIQQIRANSNRAAALTRQLLAFSRQQTLRPVVLQLPDVVSEATQLLRRLIGVQVELVVSHGRDLAPVRADPGQLGQVVMNLVVNARDAIHARGDGRGRITVSTSRITASDVRDLQNEIIPAGDYTALMVEDDGKGIAAANLAKIYEPFFTTKEQGKGTGLGLSTVYGFVKQSGGFVFADSEPNKGTRFTVYLPAHSGPLPQRQEPQRGPSTWAGGGSVLLVEDEDAVRAVAERALTRQGYRVTPASDGEEALELVRGGGSFDLVVSDVVMPIMDGPAMAREIRKFAPELPVLFISGYAEEQLRRQLDFGDVHFLGKPFSVQQITDRVGEVLGGRRGQPETTGAMAG